MFRFCGDWLLRRNIRSQGSARDEKMKRTSSRAHCRRVIIIIILYYISEMETYSGLPSAKQQLLQRIELHSLPRSYRENTPQEETELEYVENFRRQFVQIFPKRRELLLCPVNEAGVRVRHGWISARAACIFVNSVGALILSTVSHDRRNIAQKFVCSTVRPTNLATDEVYDLRSAASFVADFFDRFRSHSEEWKKLGDSETRA